MTANK